MRRFIGYFVRGLVVLGPLALTGYVLWWVLRGIDGWLDLDRWLGVHIPGVGLVTTVALITLVGFFASTVITRQLLRIVEEIAGRLPFVRLLYNSSRDLLNAFVGEHKRFDRPVLVSVGGGVNLVGFLTQEALSSLPHTTGHVAVYCPQSYHWAGQLLIVPAENVHFVDGQAADVLAFIVSGGVTGAPFGGKGHSVAKPKTL